MSPVLYAFFRTSRCFQPSMHFYVKSIATPFWIRKTDFRMKRLPYREFIPLNVFFEKVIEVHLSWIVGSVLDILPEDAVMELPGILIN